MKLQGENTRNRAVFLDRDGTINEEMGYINHVSRFRIFDFAAQAIKIFNKLQFKVVVITNQAGVAKGYFDEALVKELHLKLKEALSAQGAVIDAIYYCPHHPTEGYGEYKKDCPCRKPNIGMIEKAANELHIDIKRSIMIGDRYKDTQMAHKAGMKAIMVLTGYGKGEYTYQRNTWTDYPDHIAEDLLEAAYFLQNNQM